MKLSKKSGYRLGLAILIILVVTMAGCHHRNNVRIHEARAQKVLQRMYKDKGLAGQIRVTSASEDTTEADLGAYTVNYTYTEKVNGKRVKNNYETIFNHWLTKPEYEKPFPRGAVSTRDFMSDRWSTEYNAPLGEYAERQPFVKQQYAQERAALNRQLPENFYVSTDSPSYLLSSKATVHSARFKQLKREILANRKKGLPYGGFYNLNIPKLAKNGTFDFEVDISYDGDENDAANQNYPEDSKAQDRMTLATVQGMDFSGFWDGTYYFKFADPYTDGDLTHDVKAVIKNGRVQKATSVEAQ